MSEQHPPECPCHEPLPKSMTLDFEDDAVGIIMDDRGFRCAVAEMGRKAEHMQRRLRELRDTEPPAASSASPTGPTPSQR